MAPPAPAARMMAADGAALTVAKAPPSGVHHTCETGVRHPCELAEPLPHRVLSRAARRLARATGTRESADDIATKSSFASPSNAPISVYAASVPSMWRSACAKARAATMRSSLLPRRGSPLATAPAVTTTRRARPASSLLMASDAIRAPERLRSKSLSQVTHAACRQSRELAG
eukprot:CAMPEP_0180092530 /NCGR_PEP_ID=MMETSP0985-20121206/24573_1 /TAXON_ID=483367 /ORGANISM="non described non described, Strain CCMP 2436" /LENGTH=172 /DNA_ID=CAMNT_0022027523 /DNA_START=153 /DNA_END=672 /DNA_ORIENTATION=+